MLTLGVLFHEEKKEKHSGGYHSMVSWDKLSIWQNFHLEHITVISWTTNSVNSCSLFPRHIGLQKCHLICYWVTLFIPNIYHFWRSTHEAESCEIIQAIHIWNWKHYWRVYLLPLPRPADNNLKNTILWWLTEQNRKCGWKGGHKLV